MSNEPFSLDDLIPELLEVTLGGQVYTVKTVAHMGPTDYAAFKRLQRRVAAVAPRLEQADDAAAAQLQAAVDEMVRLLIPDLSDVTRISFARKSAFLDWWRKQHPEPPPGEAPARGPTPAKRSRASSSPATTRKPS
jgi:hypothetical protein